MRIFAILEATSDRVEPQTKLSDFRSLEATVWDHVCVPWHIQRIRLSLPSNVYMYREIFVVNVIMIVPFFFRRGYLNIVQFLVDGQHCNLEAKDNNGWTALHYAALYVYQQCYYLVLLVIVHVETIVICY